MKLNDYYRPLSAEQRDEYAKRVGTSTGNIESHWLPRRKIPRKPAMYALADATDGAVSYEEVVGYFYFSDVDRYAA